MASGGLPRPLAARPHWRDDEAGWLIVRPTEDTTVSAELRGPFTLRDGTLVTIRPIHPDDEPAMVRFHQSLSDESVYLRYFHPLKLGVRIAHDRLARICHADPAHETVLVAELPDADIVAVGRLTRRSDGCDGEFAIVVSDAAQGHGLGTEMLRRLVASGREGGLARITGDILPENGAMQAVAERVGFTCAYVGAEGLVRATLTLE